MTIEINGIAHVILTVSRFDLARAFYGKLLPEFGMKSVYDGDRFFYCVGARTAIGIEPDRPALAPEGEVRPHPADRQPGQSLPTCLVEIIGADLACPNGDNLVRLCRSRSVPWELTQR